MAAQVLALCILKMLAVLAAISSLGVADFSDDEFSIAGFEFDALRGDYTPPAPPPPSPPPHPPSVSCDDGLGGIGSLDTLCELNSSLSFEDDVYIEGNGSLYILPSVTLSCPLLGCSILINVSGDFSLGRNSTIIAGLVFLSARAANFSDGSLINATGLAGEPPAETSGTPSGLQGGGGGHGGRGASCVTDNTKLPDDVWGGDAYSWLSLDKPASYGSRGGSTSKEVEYGGEGGGRIWVEVDGTVDVCGSVLADGGYGGLKGGGGSGGSIYIKAHRIYAKFLILVEDRTGSGRISAAGGDGFAGGGGGRVSINVFSRHDNTQFFVHGLFGHTVPVEDQVGELCDGKPSCTVRRALNSRGRSLGCTENSGAAGTYYDAVPRSLTVSNHNMSTQTDTLMWEFPKQPLWTNVYIRDHAKALVPLYWSRVQVQGQIHLSCGATLSFGLAHYSSSEFELMAEELLMSDSVIFGALRMSVKIYLMWKSKMLIDGGSDAIVATSFLEASNIVVLKESSVIQSTTNLGVHGQGFLNLSGPGNLIEAQRLAYAESSPCNVKVGLGSFLRGPLESANSNYMTPRLYCHLPDCPVELIHPPEDCNVNSTLAFTIQVCHLSGENLLISVRLVHNSLPFVFLTICWGCLLLQICRVEVVAVEGTITGSVIHFHLVRAMIIPSSGLISASGLGCYGGVGRGKMFENGLAGGGGHGGKGGDGYYNGKFIDGGIMYGDAGLPCELGSGSGNNSLAGATAGGGIIVIGSLEHSLSSLSIEGSLKADGESFGEDLTKQNHRSISKIGPGGGSGGTILLFVNTLALGNSSTISTVGGHGSPNGGGGGGGGRVHFHWSEIPIGDAYLPIARKSVCLSFLSALHGSGGYGRGHGRAGQNGTVTGKACPEGLYGGVTETPCPYKCISDRYRMPNCYTALEELVYTFGGPWWFGFILLGILILLALVLSVARTKYVGVDEVPTLVPARHCSPIDHSFPYEDAFIRFVDEINGLAAYQWWEGSIYSILSVLAYPLAWLWLQRCRKNKLQQLREYVRSEYDHACLRSCRSRALYEGLKVAATSDLMLAYVDFFLGGDEKRADLPTRLHQRFPMSIVFGGDGSYMAPFFLHSDNILTSLMSQSIPPTIWYRLVAGLNAQLRLVRRGHLKITFSHVVTWLGTHANPTLRTYGVHVDLAWFQSTAFGYCQFGLVVCAAQNENMLPSLESPNISLLTGQESWDESEWWVLPSGLAVCKLIQAQLIDRHVANQEIQDPSLYSNDSDVFWQS
ncbi:hypothetical protein L484_005490 [Morus notabilis]|uniref:Uncharacterized protein n=1 Tax=Morus notabilis TaxID=981085 RepID=W9QIZ8_9ROSA|nr:hypothetical protein L484_005490 [Morus notabilis]